MRNTAFSVALILVVLFTTPAQAEEFLAIGPTTGWSIRQVSIQPEGGPQLDLSYQFIELGLSAQVFGLREWVGLRVSGGMNFFQNLSLERTAQSARYSQHALWAELTPVFTYTWGKIGIQAGAGISFIHYFEGCIRSTESAGSAIEGPPCRTQDEAGYSRIAAQEMLQVPAFVGATVDLGNVIVAPEFGVAYGVWYGTEAPDVRDGLKDGSITSQNLDFWLRIAVRFPLL